MGLHSIKKLLHSKRKNYMSEVSVHRIGKKVFSSLSSYKRLISRLYKEFKNLTPKEQRIQSINGQMN
jgi:hypothetical protein